MSSTNPCRKPAEPQSLKRLHISTQPRTTSSLLVKILNLRDQPGVVSAAGGGYFLLYAARRIQDLNIMQICHGQRAETGKRRSSLHFKAFVAYAKEAGQTMVIKEKVTQMVDPVSMSNYMYGPKTASVSHLLHEDTRSRGPPTLSFRISSCSRGIQRF
ncbi:hypothetical protein N7451_004027 [Penicillium sp. IBT 35674x]|nr:hypothetical protein N7451_004027 [Penicillium sp. IBT 35674x]